MIPPTESLSQGARIALTKAAGLSASFVVLPVISRVIDRHLKAPGESADLPSPPFCHAARRDGANLAAGMAASYVGASAAKKLLGAHVSQGKLAIGEIVDGGITLGAMLMVERNLRHHPENEAPLPVQSMLRKLGFTEEAAHCGAHTLLTFVLPQAAGTAAGLAFLLSGRGR